MSPDPFPFRDPRLPERKRVDDLLARLTLDERIAMLHQFAPPVERLGLAAFRTGQEALHGVAWMGPATVFPQAVGLGATWNPELVRRVGEAVGREARAMRRRDPRVGLNVWAPVVNLLRDPRWGRNEEGYSEDPRLTSAIAVAYTRGLRGDHPERWRTAPVLKHWLAHNNETDRDTSSSSVPPRVLHEYDLAAFRPAVEAGAVAGVMPAYNLVNGRPNHLSPYLREQLRSWTERDLVVCSDAGAPSNLVDSERYFPTHEEATAAALRAGVDSFTDHDQDPTEITARVRGALERGLIDEADIDTAVRRLLTMRCGLGEFDGAEDPYAAEEEAYDTAGHRALALEAAEQAVVLLKNDGLLPLPGNGGTVAVVGPLADTCKLDWYSGHFLRRTTLREALVERLGAERVTFTEGSDTVRLGYGGGWVHVPEAPAEGAGAETGGASLNPARLAGRTDLPPVTVGDRPTDLAMTDWGGGVLTLRAPDGRYLTVADDGFVRAAAERPGGWVVQETFALEHRQAGANGLLLRHLGSGGYVGVAQGGLRVVAGGADGAGSRGGRAAGTVAENANGSGAGEGAGASGGGPGLFVLDVIERGEDAVALAAAGAGTVVVAAGNDPHINGRETEDRTTLALPTRQDRLWRAAHAANPRTALILSSSCPYAVADADTALPALLWTAHGGQSAGEALARVLFGDVSPAGRLPQTWYADDGQLPETLLDYDIISARSTYLYFDGTPLYPFGHGLSYTRFAYDDLRVAPDGSALTARLTVANTGAVPGDEVVQLYVRALGPGVPRPHRRLIAHRRLPLAPGASRRLDFTVPLSDLGHWDVAHGRWTVAPGTYEIQAGGSSGDIRLTASITVPGPPPAPRPVRERGLEAADYDAADGVVLVDRTKASGDAIAPAGPAPGTLLYRDCDFGTGTGAVVTVETARTGAGEAAVELRLADGTHLGTAAVPENGPDTAYDRYAYGAVRPARAGALPAGVHDLRVTVRGPLRLARIAFGAAPVR